MPPLGSDKRAGGYDPAMGQTRKQKSNFTAAFMAAFFPSFLWKSIGA